MMATQYFLAIKREFLSAVKRPLKTEPTPICNLASLLLSPDTHSFKIPATYIPEDFRVCDPKMHHPDIEVEFKIPLMRTNSAVLAVKSYARTDTRDITRATIRCYQYNLFVKLPFQNVVQVMKWSNNQSHMWLFE